MSALQGLSQQSGSTCLYDHQHPGGGVEGPMESLAEIMARVEQLAFAREQERQGNPQALQRPSSLEQATLPLDLPAVELLPPPEYIQAEAFLEVSGYFTPSSKRIKDQRAHSNRNLRFRSIRKPETGPTTGF